jgi:S-adenosylmethionine hydrolase
VNTITLTTDFGTRDWFVGTMKGVILGINPRARVVDITHEIPPSDIRAGAFALMASCRYFPKGTLHVAVVDPGVGSRRRAIAVRTTKYTFIGPDNGVLSWVLKGEKIRTIRELENKRYFLEHVSRTFHGRDIFAPVAAHLSRGLALERLGRELKDLIRLPWPEPAKHPEELRGEIVYLDRFGNAITNIDAEMIGRSGQKGDNCLEGHSSRQPSPPSEGGEGVEVIGKRKVRCALAAFYDSVPANRAVAVIGSSDLLEIAVNGGSAACQFGLKTGDEVIVRRSPS